MFITIDEATAAEALDFTSLVASLREVFNSEWEAPLRTIQHIDQPDWPEGTLLLMPAWDGSGYMGIKTVTVYPENQQKGEAGLHSVYSLFDRRNGKPLAMISANPITAKRTAAVSALAADYLARKDANKLLIVGAGAVASEIADAYAVVRDLTEVCVWNRSAERGEKLVDKLRAQGYNARLGTDLAAEVKHADIISCATFSQGDLIKRQWLQPGAHLDLIGSFKPDMRETDAACFDGTSVFIDTEEALIKSGDLLHPMEKGILKEEHILANLTQLCQKSHPGRQNNEEITVFKAVGNAIEDLAAAKLIYEQQNS